MLGILPARDWCIKTQNSLRLSLLCVAAASFCFALSTPAQASLINITINPSTGLPANDIDFGVLPNNNPTSNFNALVTDVSLYNTFAGSNLLTPVLTGYEDDAPGTVDLTGFDYAVLHYGKGPGGAGHGGGIVFYYLNGMTGNFDFPTDGSGPNGFGGLSSIRLFGGEGNANVPDGGSTVALLGAAMAGVGLLRRYIKH